MIRLTNALTDRRFLGILLGLVITTFGFLFFAPSISPEARIVDPQSGGEIAVNSGSTAGAIALGVILLFLLTVALLLAILRLSGSDSESSKIAREITSTPTAATLLERWMRRSRFYRLIGGLIAFIASFTVLGDDSELPQLLFMLLCGVALGGALAEVHVLRQRRGTVAAADLSVRTVRHFTDPTDLAAMGLTAIGAICVLTAVGLGWTSENAAKWSAGALAVIGAVLGFQFLVARRSRPALRPELRNADDLLRFLAATQGFARPAISVAFFMLANSVRRNEPSSALQLASTILFILGLVWWYRGRHGRIPQLAQARMVP